MQLAVLADGGEGFLLDGRRPQLYALQHARVEDVDACVDAVPHKLDGLLDEAVDARGVPRLVHHDAVLGRFLDLGDDNGAFLAVGAVEVGELGEGVVADDVGVKDEEGGVVFAKDLFSQLEGTGRAERFGLD